MPCEYTAVKLKERERENERQRDKEKKTAVEREKRALIMALTAIGFEIQERNLGGGKTLITGTEHQNG